MTQQNFTKLTIGIVLILSTWACNPNANEPVQEGIDKELEKVLIAASAGKGKEFYMLPASTDFNKIP